MHRIRRSKLKLGTTNSPYIPNIDTNGIDKKGYKTLGATSPHAGVFWGKIDAGSK
jgi:hypothetical protein